MIRVSIQHRLPSGRWSRTAPPFTYLNSMLGAEERVALVCADYVETRMLELPQILRAEFRRNDSLLHRWGITMKKEGV